MRDWIAEIEMASKKRDAHRLNVISLSLIDESSSDDSFACGCFANAELAKMAGETDYHQEYLAISLFLMGVGDITPGRAVKAAMFLQGKGTQGSLTATRVAKVLKFRREQGQ